MRYNNNIYIQNTAFTNWSEARYVIWRQLLVSINKIVMIRCDMEDRHYIIGFHSELVFFSEL